MPADGFGPAVGPSAELELPKQQGPKHGALGLLNPAARGLTLAIIQAERCGRGGEDLEVLSGNFNSDNDAAAQLQMRLQLLTSTGWSKS